MYIPERGETVRVRSMPGSFVFSGYGADAGGDYAIVVGGEKHYRLERCVTVDRVMPIRRRRGRKIKTATADVRLSVSGTDEETDHG